MSIGIARVGARLSSIWDRPAARLLAIGAVLAVTLAIVVLVLRPAGAAPAPELRHSPITVTQAVTPTTALFGDRLEAVVDVYTAAPAVAAPSVRVATDFRPYTVVDTRVDRSSRRSVTLTRTVVSLQCLTTACLPLRRQPRTFHFAPTTVRYSRRGQDRTLTEPWSPVRVSSHLESAHARLAEVPPELTTETRLPPDALRLGLVAIAIACAAAGVWLVLTGLWPHVFSSRRRWRRLSELDRALAQLDAATAIDDEGLRRRVLEQLATRLGEADRASLERRTRTLAWSAHEPREEDLAALGAQVRADLIGGNR